MKASLKQMTSSILAVSISRLSVRQMKALLRYLAAMGQVITTSSFLPLQRSYSMSQVGLILFLAPIFNMRLIRFLTFSETAGSQGNLMQWVYITLISLGIELYQQGHTPQSISYNITPNDQISAFESQAAAFKIYGAMQIGEPTIVCVISPSFKSSLQKPKSASFSTPSLNSMLVGFKSLWRILVLKRAMQASLIWLNIQSASFSVSFPLSLMSSERVPPSQNSQTRQKLELVLSISLNLMMLGWSILVSTVISMLVNSDSLGCSLNISILITLTANRPASTLFSALQTLPYCPEPIFYFRQQFQMVLLMGCITYTEYVDNSVISFGLYGAKKYR